MSNKVIDDLDDSKLEGFDEEQVALMKEEVILLDKNDNAIGAATKKFSHLWSNIKEGKALHRAFSVLLFNENNELLLQQRSAEKITFPLRWTNTCCSHPLSIKTEIDGVDGVKNAAIRKLEHELGIPQDTFSKDEFIYLSRIIYQAQSDDPKWGESEIDYILYIKTNKLSNKTINFVRNEVNDIKWVSQDELKQLILNRKELDITISPWFHMIMDQFGYKWWDQLDTIIKNNGLVDKDEAGKIYALNIDDHIVT